MAATKSYSAQLTFDDSNNDQAPATEVLRDIFSLKVGDECVIDIRNFQLIDVTPNPSGRWEFEFTLRVLATSACGTLDSSLDIVNGISYLASVGLKHEDVIDAIDCNCDKVIVVSADVEDGASGEFYGQLDVRDEESGVIQITDSCVFDLQ